MPKTYVLSVGVSDYQHIPALRLPKNDAEAMVRLFENRHAEVMTLLNEQATKSNILTQLKSCLAKSQPQDLVIFYFSGHGYPGGFCPYDMRLQGDNGLSYEEIKSAFKECKASKKMIIADACYAGQFRRESGTPEVRAEGFHRKPEQDKDSNVLLFLSSRSGETSIESPFMANGLFTSSLLRGLRGGADVNLDRLITARELFDYVSQTVREKSQDKQHPVMWGKFDDNMVIADWRK